MAETPERQSSSLVLIEGIAGTATLRPAAPTQRKHKFLFPASEAWHMLFPLPSTLFPTWLL